MKKNRLKMIISIVSAAVMLSAAIFSYAYFSYNYNWEKEHSVETGIFSAVITIDEEMIVNFNFSYPTTINLPEITDDGTQIGKVIYNRRADDSNFDTAVIGFLAKIENTGEIDIKIMPQIEFYLGSKEVNYIKYFVISQAEYNTSASFQSYIRHYAKISGEIDYYYDEILDKYVRPAFERDDTVEDFWQDAYNKIQTIAEENDRVLQAALKASTRQSKITPGNEADFYIFMWLDFAALEQHYKGTELKEDFFLNNLDTYIHGDLTDASFNITAKITVKAEQYNE